MNTKGTSLSTRAMVYTALLTAVLCAVAPMTISIGPIPLSLATLVMYIAAATLSWKNGLLSVVLYVALGAIGLPVFSNFEGGFHKIAGVTGGFIIGYIPLSIVVGIISDRFSANRLLEILGMVIGTALLYVCGLVWFMLQTGANLGSALMVCVLPFLVGDAIKITIACIIAPALRAVVAMHR